MAIYIDPTGSSGTGSKLNPYNSFSQVNALTGDLGGEAILLKSGTRLRGRLIHSGASNFVLGHYGTGAKPIVDATAVSSVVWTLESGTTWQATVTGNQNRDNLVFADGAKLRRQSSLANCQATPMSTFWVSGTVSVNLGGSSPNSVLIEYTDLSTAAVITTGSNIVLDAVVFRSGFDTGLSVIASGNNVKLIDVEVLHAGAQGSASGRSGILLYGTSSAALSTGCEVIRCKSDGNTNAAIEFQFMDGLLVDKFSGDLNGNGIEYWGWVKNSTLRRSIVLNSINADGGGHRTGFWATGSGAGTLAQNGNHANNTVESCIFAGSRAGQIELGAGPGWKINNNTFVSTGSCLYNSGAETILVENQGADATDTVVADFKNNIIGAENASRMSLIRVGLTATNTYTGNNNSFFYNNTLDTNLGLGAFFNMTFNAANNLTFAAWKASSGQDANSTYTPIPGKHYGTQVANQPITTELYSVGFRSDGTLTSREGFNQVLEDFDTTPLQIYLGDGIDADYLSSGVKTWATNAPPPADYNGLPFHSPPVIGAIGKSRRT